MILDWCDEPCTLQSRISGDVWGVAEWGTAIPDKCRFEDKTLIVNTATGDKAQADGIVYIPNARPWKLQDRLNFGGESFEIIRRRVFRDLDGPRYQSFFVQRQAE